MYIYYIWTTNQRKARARKFCTARKCVAMASCPVPTLDSLESFIRDQILKDKKTHKQVRDFLLKRFPGARGFSIRSIERFCSARGIHRTARLCDSALDEAVSNAVKKVHKLYNSYSFYTRPYPTR